MHDSWWAFSVSARFMPKITVAHGVVMSLILTERYFITKFFKTFKNCLNPLYQNNAGNSWKKNEFLGFKIHSGQSHNLEKHMEVLDNLDFLWSDWY